MLSYTHRKQSLTGDAEALKTCKVRAIKKRDYYSTCCRHQRAPSVVYSELQEGTESSTWWVNVKGSDWFIREAKCKQGFRYFLYSYVAPVKNCLTKSEGVNHQMAHTWSTFAKPYSNVVGVAKLFTPTHPRRPPHLTLYINLVQHL